MPRQYGSAVPSFVMLTYSPCVCFSRVAILYCISTHVLDLSIKLLAPCSLCKEERDPGNEFANSPVHIFSIIPFFQISKYTRQVTNNWCRPKGGVASHASFWLLFLKMFLVEIKFTIYLQSFNVRVLLFQIWTA